ncbi:MAG: hypothetical protein MR008_03880 [Aerococcus sp.]|nr:hypothetical protein [Aerococcus sp.]
MYIFPLFFILVPPIGTRPVFKVAAILIGFTFWMVQTYLISKFITVPRKMEEAHQRVRESGQRVQAEILAAGDVWVSDDYPSKRLLVQFQNLSGNAVKAYVTFTDTQVEAKRFAVGNALDLKLNTSGSAPAFTIDGATYERTASRWPWVWLIFNIIYMVVFFIGLYIMQRYVWKLSLTSPWMWAPILGTIMLLLELKTIGNPHLNDSYYSAGTAVSAASFGELLLHGTTTEGQVINFAQTGTYINQQPEISFSVMYTDASGHEISRRFKQVIPLTELYALKKGEADVIYLPNNTNQLMIHLGD